MRHIRDEGIISASTCLRRAAGWLAGPLLGLLASQNSAAQTTVTYDYDSLGRLVQAQMPALGSVQSYTYDAAGNILSSNLTALTTLSIGGVSVSQGPSGTQVTIYGKHLLPGMYGFNEEVVCRRRADRGVAWNWNVGLLSPPLPAPVPECR